jgi:hypothetical protein
LGIGHLYVKNYEQVAFLIWVFVCGHAFSTKLYRIPGTDNPAWWTGNPNAPSVEVLYQDARKT